VEDLTARETLPKPGPGAGNGVMDTPAGGRPLSRPPSPKREIQFGLLTTASAPSLEMHCCV
jgi:hypothetical protein